MPGAFAEGRGEGDANGIHAQRPDSLRLVVIPLSLSLSHNGERGPANGVFNSLLIKKFTAKNAKFFIAENRRSWRLGGSKLF
jgi:hypothetical protein